MRDLQELVENLPECEPKGALRGLATAARMVSAPEREAIIERMAAVVRRWREGDPLTALERELGERGHSSQTGTAPAFAAKTE